MFKSHTTINIRQVKKSDEPILAKIIRGVFEEHNAPRKGTVYSDPATDNLYELFQHPKSILWVAELNGEIAGCCGIYPTRGLPADCAELVKFYLSQKTRGKGIGKELMKKSMASAYQMGYKKLYLESLSQFSNAVRMYEKQGFLRLSAPLGSSEHTSCNIWMLRYL